MRIFLCYTVFMVECFYKLYGFVIRTNCSAQLESLNPALLLWNNFLLHLNGSMGTLWIMKIDPVEQINIIGEVKKRIKYKRRSDVCCIIFFTDMPIIYIITLPIFIIVSIQPNGSYSFYRLPCFKKSEISFKIHWLFVFISHAFRLCVQVKDTRK